MHSILHNPKKWGPHWENEIAKVISAVLKGEPMDDIWENKEIADIFDKYQKINEDPRKLILSLFLYYNEELRETFDLEIDDFII